ncbi:hypothetical protein [Pajaroellobacter abortibovis]|nr:hypothetical protein [Pajaroellobacter abortibovis]
MAAVRHKLIVGAEAIASFVPAIYLARFVGSEFVTSEDKGQFIADIEFP